MNLTARRAAQGGMDSSPWLDLESRFRSLQPALAGYRLDYQWGSAGEHWHLQGGVHSMATTEFETLSALAGDLLLALPPQAVAPEALADPNPKHRWYLALWHHLTDKVPKHMVWEADEQGNKLGTIFTGSVEQPVHASAVLCLQFSTVPTPTSTQTVPPTTLVARLNHFIAREASERRALWALIAFLITLLVAILAL